MPANVMAKKREPSVAVLNTWPLTFWGKKHGACWLGDKEGGVVTRDGQVGLARGLQFSCSFSTAWKTGGNNLASPTPPSSLTPERTWAKSWSFISAWWIYAKCSLNPWFLREVLWPQLNTCVNWKAIRAITIVYCIQKRCHTSPPLALIVVSYFTCPAVRYMDWLHI